MIGGMIANWGDMYSPSSKLWLLMRIGLVDIDAKSDDGHTLDSLLEDRTDPEALVMKQIIELYRDKPEQISVMLGDTKMLRSFPVPESVREYLEFPENPDQSN